MRPPTRALPALLPAAALAVIATLAAVPPAATAESASSASASSAASAASAAPEVTLGALTPVRVSPTGAVALPLRNDGGAGTVSLSVSWTDPAAGVVTELGRSTTRAKARSTTPVTIQLTDAGLRTLRSRTWLDAVVTSGDEQQPITLVAPTDTTADPANADNPLAGGQWATYEGSLEPAWGPFTQASGTTQAQLARVALQPKARWFGSWTSPQELQTLVQRYVAAQTADDPDALVQLTTMYLSPWEGDACKKAPTSAQMARNRAYARALAAGIGDARAAVVVQPDGPFAMCEPGTRHLLAKAVGATVHALAALPRTSAYIEVGASDWADPAKVVALLKREDITEARGIATGVTHAAPLGDELAYVDAIVDGLADDGITGVHAVVDTSDNGRGFTGRQLRAHDPKAAAWSSPACTRAGQRFCLATGVPPTTDVADARWGLSAAQQRIAARLVDGYLWVKRPWLDPAHRYAFSVQRAVGTVRFSPFS